MTSVAQSVAWAGLRDSVVRDLGWLLASADLLAPSEPAPLARPWPADDTVLRAWFAALDADPSPLHREIDATRATRLGRYAETLLAYFLAHGPTLRLVAANLPIRLGGRTLGECDFLLEGAAGERLHWELAVKCYLCAAEAGEAALSDYVGPNLADRLDLKYRRLVDHQLRLTLRDEFAFAGQPGPWAAQMLVKGWLFYREGSAVRPPATIDPRHSRGFWVTRGDWPALAAREPAGTHWRVLPRLDWLAPRRIVAGEDVAPGVAQAASDMLSDAAAIIARVAARPAPSLVAAFVREADGTWHETRRGFVVDDAWPAAAAALAQSIR
ncbi:MAG: hypothetical protein GAK40_00366 [Burkholderia plantarii]|nr:MAG: hypothetical protein GAK40_00366 [Burkholderia plantarii]